ncbi:uncharacterized protein LOC122795968 [Protopterus annectens]|uniref:uncharacterized protein LOC122795968 n=1 Tax=Protopterus annectens TaxID=7888 RepID=UPI001CFB8326|nr:uncharacterized protein LOC122795968 [Protopterus annectens]
MSRSNHRRADRVGDGFLLPIPSPSGISGFYSQEAINEHVEQYKENTMSFLIRKLVRDNPDKLPLSPDEKYSQSIFLGLESAEEKNDYDKDSFFDGSDDSCCENDDNDESGWIQAMYQFQKYGSNVKYEGSDPLGSEIHFDVAHELHTYTDEESLSEINSDSEEEETIKSSKHDISVLSEKEPPSTSKRKSPEGQESHDGSERIYNGIHARDSKESEDC